MTFIDFIKKYYASAEHKEISVFLINLGIYKDIESSLNDFYQSALSRNKNEITIQLVLTLREFVSTIYKPLNDVIKGQESGGTEHKIAELIKYLIKDTYQKSGLEFSVYIDLFMKTAKKTYTKHSWDFFVLEKFISFDKIKLLTIALEENMNEQAFRLSKPLKLDWMGDRPLDFFVDDLVKTFKGVKCKKKLYQLFEIKKTDFKIEMPSKHLLPFLTLFHDLHGYGVIKVNGNRGLFIYLSHHLQAPPNDRYPQREFRKLRYDAKYNKKVNCKILAIIEPLLDKYCCNFQSGR